MSSQAFCRQAFELLTEVATCPPENLPPYNDDAVRGVLDEIQLQHDQLTAVFNATMERHRAAQARGDAEADDADGAGGAAAAALWRGSEAEAAEVMVYHAAILRNKRLLLAYAARRLDLARELRWTRGGAPPAARAALSPGEAEFARGYARLLGGYCRSRELGGVGLDLTADAAPPADPFVQVRVLRDYGEAAFSCGSVKLRRGQSHWLPRDEAHPLVQDGVLECVGGE